MSEQIRITKNESGQIVCVTRTDSEGRILWVIAESTQQPVVPEGFSLIANEILDRFPEINSSNYSHDDVDRLNAWGIELVLSAGKGGE